MNKKNIILLSALFALSTLKIHAPEFFEEPIVAHRTISAEPNNTIHIQEAHASTAAHFQASEKPFTGKIIGVSINPKTSSSTITEQISQKLGVPLSSQERSLLTKAFDKARAPITDPQENGKQWDAVNAQLEKILAHRPGSELTEHQFLDALSTAEKTSTFSNVINKISTFFSHFTTSGAQPSTEHQGLAITFSDKNVQSSITTNNANTSLKNLDSLIESTQKALKQNPHNTQLQNQLTQATSQKQKLTGAIQRSSSKALQTQPDTTEFLGFERVAQAPELSDAQAQAELDRMAAESDAQQAAMEHKKALQDLSAHKNRFGDDVSNLSNSLDPMSKKTAQDRKQLLANALATKQKLQTAQALLTLRSSANPEEGFYSF